MNPSRLFIERPVGTSLLMVAIMLVGMIAYRFLPLSALPEVDYPTIRVLTLYPGAGPEVMTSSITAPLERQFGQMPGLNQMTSTSSAGASAVTLQFDLSLSLDIAEQQVQAAINAAGNLLPADLPAPPIYAKVNPADAPIITLAITSKTDPLTKVHDLVDTRLAQKLSQLPGVGLVSLEGGQKPGVRIRANPTALAAYGLNIDDLRTTISNANVNTPKGNFDGPARAYTINANDQITNPALFLDIIVAYRNGAPVRLKEVATVEEGQENNRIAAWSGATQAVIVNVQRQPGANVIAVVDAIKTLLPQLRDTLPTSFDVAILTDRTLTIRASVHDVQIELGFAVGLVVLVIFAFLGDVRATIIPSLSVPLSLVGTLAVMYLLGYSLNNLSIMALVIATGFVVDDAIVMIENIARYIEAGETPFDAALKGSAQIAFTVVSLTVSLIAVLIPLLFMGDVVGRLFSEFAVTLSITILISAVVSLTLVPMMAAQLFKQRPVHEGAEHGEGEKAALGARWFAKMIDLYDRSLVVVLRHQTLTLLVALITVALTVLLYIVVPKGFFPIQDTGIIQGITEASQSVSFQAMTERQRAMVDAILNDPDVESLTSFVGVDGTNPTLNSGRMLINLKPRSERTATASQIIRRLQRDTASVPGIVLYMQPAQDLTIDSTVSKTQYQFVLDTPKPEDFDIWVPRLMERLARVPQIVDVASDLQSKGLSIFIRIDRDAAARFGITVATVDNALYDAFGQRIVSTVYTQSNQYRVIYEVDPMLTKSIDSLNGIYLPASGAGGKQVPLASIATFEERTSPLRLDRLSQFPATTISFNLAPGAALGDAVDAINAARVEVGIPRSIGTHFQGAALAFQKALDSQLLLILAAIVTVYIVLGVLYESYIHPITILSTLPSAGIGALLALLLGGADLSVVAIIGIVLLIGIVKKNAIMMIDFALDAERNEGKSPQEAIHQACLLRFRPILMTTIAALVGALPLMLGSGTGSELRHPLGLTIVGGLIVSQMLTLFTTPVIYLFFDRLGRRIRGVPSDPTPEETRALPAPPHLTELPPPRPVRDP